MLFADPLSRVCAPTEGWHNPGIPSKVATLLKHLPNAIREAPRIKLYAGKDTSGISKFIYQWRKSKNLLASYSVLLVQTVGAEFRQRRANSRRGGP